MERLVGFKQRNRFKCFTANKLKVQICCLHNDSTPTPITYIHGNKTFERTDQCYYMLLSAVNISHTGINPSHFSQNSFIHEILRLFTFCPYSVNVTENTCE